MIILLKLKEDSKEQLGLELARKNGKQDSCEYLLEHR